MGLPEVMHVELEEQVRVLDCDTSGGDNRTGVPARRAHAPTERRSVQAVEHKIECLDHVVPQVREHAAERGCDAGKTRHQRTFRPI